MNDAIEQAKEIVRGTGTAGVTLDQINRTIAKIEASLKDWEEGRMTSPDDRDHVIAACEVLNLDWHQIDRGSDNDIIGKIAEEVYEDSGETITDIPDLATYILTRLFQEGLRPVEGETPQESGMYLSVRLDGEEIQGYPLIDGNDSFNAAAERGAIDFAYDTLERTRPLCGEVAIHVLPEPPKDEVLEEETPKREFLVHLNIQIDAEKDGVDVEQVEKEIAAALEVGLGGEDYTPTLTGAEVEIALAEEI